MKVTLILTTTIFTHNVEFNRQRKHEERINQYILKIKKWLNQTKFNIVVVENSGYNFNELPDNNHRFEKIIYKYDQIPICDKKFLDNNRAKGQHESYAIKYAIENSELIKNSTHLIKITGRFFMPLFEKIISENLKDETLFIRQFNNEQCEIVGCKYDLKEYLFDFPKKDDHVENEYFKKINTYKEPFDVWMNENNEVLVLPEMKLDCKTRRGLGTYYRYL